MSKKAFKFCRSILSDVSRSFALTIPMLDDELYRPVMIAYLQDRLLDNFEDEGTLSVSKRKHLMNRVVEIFDPENTNPGDVIEEIEENANLMPEKSLYRLTANTHLLYEAYTGLKSDIKNISFKWLQEMNQGMQKYLSESVDTFDELDEYCYYVAGTVGGFLTELLIYLSDISRDEEVILKNNFVDAGLFLQKVNIIRDIKKDVQKRDKNFWPLQELVLSEDMLLDDEFEHKTMEALQKMIANVQKHIKGLASYMQNIPDKFSGYRRFFSVNNTLGLATLEKMRDNSDVFYGNKKVKVSKLMFLRILKSPEKMFYRKSKNYI